MSEIDVYNRIEITKQIGQPVTIHSEYRFMLINRLQANLNYEIEDGPSGAVQTDDFIIVELDADGDRATVTIWSD